MACKGYLSNCFSFLYLSLHTIFEAICKIVDLKKLCRFSISNADFGLNNTLFTIGEYGYYDSNNQIQAVCDAFSASSNPPFKSLNFYNPSTNATKGYAATIINNQLYVGGKFSHAGSNQVNNIAQFDPTPLNTSIKVLDENIVTVFPNPASNWI